MTRFGEQYEATRKAFLAACESTRKASAELAALVSLGVPMPIVASARVLTGLLVQTDNIRRTLDEYEKQAHLRKD